MKKLFTIGLKLYLLISVLFIIFATFSCTSKSGQLANKPFEKVVVLDASPIKNDITYSYKVKRIEHGVVDYAYTKEL